MQRVDADIPLGGILAQMVNLLVALATFHAGKLLGAQNPYRR